jgi:ATP-binding protein involved in chromosome partitioning
MFKTLEVPILGIVENMSYLEMPDGSKMDLFGSGGGEKLAESTGTPFLGQVPIDQNVRIGGDSGKPIVDSHPESPVAKSLTDIAMKIAQKTSVAALGANNSLPINIVE